MAQERPASRAAGGAGARASKLRPIAAPERVQVSFRDATLPELVRFVARVTGRRFILTGSLSDVRVTVVSRGLATRRQVWRLFVDALAMQGVTVVRAGPYFRIVGSEGVERRATPVVVDRGPSPEGEAFGVHVFRVRQGSVEEAAALLANFSSPAGTITTHPPTRTLIVNDTSSHVRRMMAILRELRTRPQPERIYVEPVRQDADRLANELRELAPE